MKCPVCRNEGTENTAWGDRVGVSTYIYPSDRVSWCWLVGGPMWTVCWHTAGTPASFSSSLPHGASCISQKPQPGHCWLVLAPWQTPLTAQRSPEEEGSYLYWWGTTYVCNCTSTCTCSLTRVHTHKHTHTYTFTPIHAQTRTNIQTHIHTQVRTR